MRSISGVLASVVLAAAALASDVGDKAPDIDVTFLQGDPIAIDQCAGKKIVVLEFWATWCDACKKAIPRVARLAEKYKAKDVEVVAVSDETPDEVKAFLKDGKVKYRVACDKDRNTFGSYLRGNKPTKHAPFAVVVDKTGVVTWQGPVGSSLERVVGQIVDGKFDAEKAKKLAEMERTVADGIDTKSYDQAAGDADPLLEADPGNEVGLNAKFKKFEHDKDGAACKAFAEKRIPLIWDDANALNVVGWNLATVQNMALRFPDLALKSAKRSVELSEWSESMYIDTLARAQFECAMLDQAIETQKKAVALDEKDEEMKAALDFYVRCADARKSAK